MDEAEIKIEGLESLIAAQSKVLDLVAANAPIATILDELEVLSATHQISHQQPWIQDQFARLREIALERHAFQNQVGEMLADERRRLAEALHDDPIQAITSVGLRLQKLSRSASPEQREQFADIQRTVSSAVGRMRQMLFDLHPPTLDDEGLGAAVELYLYERFDPEDIDWELDYSNLSDLSPSTRSLAYRLTREALSNTLSHAAAKKVVVSLETRDGLLWAEVLDDGQGFDTASLSAARPGHLGTRNSGHLARRASGEWTIESSPGRGTAVRFRLPVGLAA